MTGSGKALIFSTGAAGMIAVLAYGRLDLTRSRLSLVAAQLLIPLLFLCWGFFKDRDERRPNLACFVLIAVLVMLSPVPDAYVGGAGFGIKSLAVVGLIALGAFLMRSVRVIGGPGVACCLCCLTILVAWVGFWQTSGGRLIFSDDHPAFLYRLAQLKENFPVIPFWNPSWNGGVEAREFFPSGALGLFLVWWPIIACFDLLEAYNVIVLLTLFVLIPGAIGLAGYHLTRDREAGWLSGALGVTASLIWYRWALEYGTLPFLTSAAMLSLVLTLSIRIQSVQADWRLSHSVLLFFATSLAVFWTLSALLLVPCLLLGLVLTLDRSRRLHLAGVCTVLTIIHLPWVLLFLEASQVLSFLTASAGTKIGTHSVHAHRFVLPAIETHGVVGGVLLVAREFLGAGSPLVLILALPAVMMLERKDRRMMGVIVGLAVLLAAAGPVVKPRLELHRFWLVAVVLIVPAVGAACRMCLATHPSRILRLLLLMGLCYSPLWLWKVTSNRTSIQPVFASDEVYELSAAIERYGGDGRTLFAGFILHELSAGHIAPLPLLTTKPMIASSYQHDRWQYTEVIPPEFLRDSERGVRRYLDAMNVTLIVAHEPKWKKRFRKDPRRFPELGRVGRFVLFGRAEYYGNYVMEGDAEFVAARDNAVTFRMRGESAVVKFRYLPLLESDRCDLEPFPVSDTVSLVKIKGCQDGDRVTIFMRGPVQRLARW
jgi:hypothetical protein